MQMFKTKRTKEKERKTAESKRSRQHNLLVKQTTAMTFVDVAA
jgi:hypothetical protein